MKQEVRSLTYALLEFYSCVVGIVQTPYTRANIDTLQSNSALSLVVMHTAQVPLLVDLPRSEASSSHPAELLPQKP